MMITTGRLEEICKAMNREYGSDSNVVIRIYDNDGNLMAGDYALETSKDEAGNLFLSNKING